MKMLCLLLCTGFFAVSASAQLNSAAPVAAGQPAKTASPAAYQFSSYVIRSEAGTYGYAVLANGQVLIWQTSIPGVPGNKGFDNKEQAERCAALVIRKLKAGETLPTVTEKELEKIMH